MHAICSDINCEYEILHAKNDSILSYLMTSYVSEREIIYHNMVDLTTRMSLGHSGETEYHND